MEPCATQSLEMTHSLFSLTTSGSASFLGCSTTTSPATPVAATTPSEAPPEAHTSTKEAHELGEEGSSASAAANTTSSAHATDVLALGLYSELAPLEQ